MESESRRPGDEATANERLDGRDYVSPNSDEVQAFLARLSPRVHVCCINIDGPLEGRYFGEDVEAAAQYVVERNKAGLNCYFTPNVPSTDCGVKPSKKQIIALRGVHVDIDPPKDGPLNKAEVCAALAPDSPSLVVDSGNGVQAYWFFPEPIEATPENVEAVEAVNRALVAKFNGDNAVSSADHLMRIPGTVNWQGKKKREAGRVPVMAKTLSGQDSFRPALDALQARFPAPVIPAPETAARPSEAPARPDSGVFVDTVTLEHLRSALNWLNADDYGTWVDVGHALKVLDEVGRDLWLEWSAMSPRFDALEAQRKWDSFKPDRTGPAAIFAKAQRAGWTNPGSVPNFALVDSSKLTAEIAAKVQGKPVRRTSYTAEELWDADFAPIEWIVPTLIAAGLTLLVGAPKLGKSWLALDLANAVAHGGFALNLHCPKGSVLYAALEDTPRRIKDRLQRICTVKPGAALTIWTEMPTLDKGGVDALRNWITSAVNPRLIVVDVLNMVRPSKGKGEDSYVYDYRSVQPLKALADEFGIGVVVVHHTRKAEADDKLERTSGTNGLTGAADTTLVLSRDSNGPVLAGRGRDVEEFELALDFDRDTCRWENLGAPSDVRRSDERAAILSAVARANAPLTPQEIANVTGQSPGNIRRLLGKMVTAGELRKEGRGKYAHPYTPGNNGNKVTNEGSLFS